MSTSPRASPTGHVDEVTRIVEDVFVQLANVQSESRIPALLALLEPRFFENRAERTERLVEICREICSDPVSRADLSVQCEVVRSVTVLLLASEANECCTKAFDAFVKLLWEYASLPREHAFSTRWLRATACACLREIELTIPGALEALVRRKERDEPSLLEKLVMHETSSAFPSYVLLFLTIMRSLCATPERPGENELVFAISLALESSVLCSIYVRCEIVYLCLELSAFLHDAGAQEYAHSRAFSLIRYHSESIGLILEALRSRKNETDALIHEVTRRAATDQFAGEQDRLYALEQRLLNMTRSNIDDSDITDGIPLTSSLNSLPIIAASIRLSIKRLEIMKQEEPSLEITLSNVIPFVEDVWRECQQPGILTSTTFELVESFCSALPYEIDQVADALVFSVLLRGSKMLSDTLLTFLSRLQRVNIVTFVSRLADAVADIPKDEDFRAFFVLIVLDLIYATPSPNELWPSKQIMGAFTRFASMKNLQFEDLLWLLDGLRLLVVRSVDHNVKVYNFALSTLDNLIESSLAGDFTTREMLSGILVLANKCFDGNQIARGQMLRLDNWCTLEIVLANSSESHFETWLRGKNQSLIVQDQDPIRNLVRRTIPMEKIVKIIRGPAEHMQNSNEKVCVPVAVEWIVDDEHGHDDLFACEFRFSPALPLVLSESIPSILVPLLSSARPHFEAALYIQPTFPSPSRLQVRVVATRKDGSMVDGVLPDIHLDFADFIGDFRPLDDAVTTQYMHECIIVREKVSHESFLDACSKWNVQMSETKTGFKLNMVLKPKYHLKVHGDYDHVTSIARLSCHVDHHVLLSYLDDFFRFS